MSEQHTQNEMGERAMEGWGTGVDSDGDKPAEKGDQVSWLLLLTTHIIKDISLLGGFSHPFLWEFWMV